MRLINQRRIECSVVFIRIFLLPKVARQGERGHIHTGREDEATTAPTLRNTRMVPDTEM